MRPGAFLILLLFTIAACPLALAAGDGTYSVHEYPLPADATYIGAMTVDASGNVWLIQSKPPVLYKLVRENGTLSNYTLDGFDNASFTGMNADDEGNVWFADPDGNRFGAYTEAANHTARFKFSYPEIIPSSIIRQGDMIWLGCREEIGEYDLRTGDFYEHFVSRMFSGISDIHFDTAGNVWFVETAMNKVGVYWRTYDKTSEYPVPTNDSGPTYLSIDDKGRLWFVESSANRLGMFDTGQFNFTEYDLPATDGTAPTITCVATIGDTVWLTDTLNGRVLRFYPDEGRCAAAALGNDTMPTFISPDSNGTLWIYEAGAKKLASLDVTEEFGQATPTPEPTLTVTPQPRKAPGFLSVLAIAALALALYARRVKK